MSVSALNCAENFSVGATPILAFKAGSNSCSKVIGIYTRNFCSVLYIIITVYNYI